MHASPVQRTLAWARPDLQPASGSEHDVLTLDVSMDDACAMALRERHEQLEPDPQLLMCREKRWRGDPLEERGMKELARKVGDVLPLLEPAERHHVRRGVHAQPRANLCEHLLIRTQPLARVSLHVDLDNEELAVPHRTLECLDEPAAAQPFDECQRLKFRQRSVVGRYCRAQLVAHPRPLAPPERGTATFLFSFTTRPESNSST
eukprot:scaffold13584_cov30-Tisochrysis_lutea.AAC.5